MRPSSFALVCALLASVAVRAEGLDRDTLLTDAPATPDKGTVRISGGTGGQGATIDGGSSAAQVSGSVGWTPFEHFSGDVGAYYQGGPASVSGPSARVRYQILSQASAGLDLAGGVRFKTVSFSNPNNGEVEFIVAAGRRFGNFDLVVNGVFGVETGGGGGKDLEVKAFAGYRFNDAVRAGIDERLQAEAGDSEAGPKIGRDIDLTVGPAVSWLIMKNVQLQALAGVAMPKKTDVTTPIGLVTASVDF